jgi:hypothetical protein
MVLHMDRKVIYPNFNAKIGLEICYRGAAATHLDLMFPA